MVLRLLFVLLVALNVAVGAWLMLGRGDAGASPPGRIDVLPLQLPIRADDASPSPTPSLHAPSETLAAASAPSASYTCLALGPFATGCAVHNARRALISTVARSRQREQLSHRSLGWWVYLPARASREQALAQAHRLAAKNVRDYFVVASGEQFNSISLGLFKDPSNARKRRDEMVAAGFSARMSERTESTSEYWLDVVLADARSKRWHRLVDALGVSTHNTGCF